MKTIKSFLLLVVLVFVTACGNKLPFKPQEPLENAALVYVYVSSSHSQGSAKYAIRINNKQTKQRIQEGEYMPLNLKPSPITLSATKQEVMEDVLKLNLEAGEIYYLKIVDDVDEGTFEFVKVDNALGAKEIKKTGLIGTNVESLENTITEIISSDDNTSATSSNLVIGKENNTKKDNLSQMDEIMKAHKMKEKGILSDAEFNAIKANILKK